MPKRRKKHRNTFPLTNIPFCPDPENHVLVNTREGSYWRLKPAHNPLNEAMARNAHLTKIVSRAASTVLNKLSPFTSTLSMGRVNLRMGHGLRRSMKERNRLDYLGLKDFEFQPDYPIARLFKGWPEVKLSSNSLEATIALSPGIVKQHNRLVTSFFFELILLHGDPADETSLRTECDTSEHFVFKETIDVYRKKCTLSLILPENARPWMALIKVNCLEGNQMARSARHYGLKVLATG